MTITHQASTGINAATNQGSASTAVAYVGVAAKRKALLLGMAYPSANTWDAVSGWSLLAELAGGAVGGNAADDHQSRVGVWERILTGAESGTVTMGNSGGGVGQVTAGAMSSYANTSEGEWSTSVFVSADDATHGTASAAAFAAWASDLQLGDVVVIVHASDTDNAGVKSNFVVTQTGITFSAATHRNASRSSTGSDGAVDSWDAEVTAGRNANALSFSYDYATASCGPFIAIRLREPLRIRPTRTAPELTSSAGLYSFGMDFTVDQDTRVTGMFWYHPPAGIKANVTARLYNNATQAVLASGTRAGVSLVDGWNWIPYDTPYTAVTGTTYTGAAESAGDHGYDNSVSLPLVSPDGHVTMTHTRYESGGGFPTTTWDAGHHGIDIRYDFNTGGGTTPVTSDLDVRWRVSALVTSDLDARWRISSRVTSDLDARWRVSSIVTSDVDVRWRVFSTTQSDLDARWRVWTGVTSDIAAVWRIAAQVTSDLDVRWITSGRVNSDLTVRWVVLSSTVLEPDAIADLSTPRVTVDLSTPQVVVDLSIPRAEVDLS